MIHSGNLSPGQKVTIEELVTAIGGSSTPVRDAMKRLESEGLVEIIPRVGAYIRRIGLQEVLEVYASKEALEPLLAQWAAQRATSDERQHLLISSQQLGKLAENGDTTEYVRLIESRRLKLFSIAGSSVLHDLFRTIDGRVRLLRYRNLMQADRITESAVEHKAIAEAIAVADSALAYDLTRAHVQSATRSLLRLIESENLASEEPKPTLLNSMHSHLARRACVERQSYLMNDSL